MTAPRRSARVASRPAKPEPSVVTEVKKKEKKIEKAPKKAEKAPKKVEKAPKKIEKAPKKATIDKKKEPPKKAAATKAKAPKKEKEATAKPAVKPKKAAPAAPPTTDKDSFDTKKKTVAVEACKSWGAFKTRAGKIVKAVGERAFVQINKEKPGKGNFIVTVDGIDEPIVSLLGLKRPFPALKALDMDEINSKILKALEQ